MQGGYHGESGLRRHVAGLRTAFDACARLPITTTAAVDVATQFLRIGAQLAFPTLTLLVLDGCPKQFDGIFSIQAFFRLLLRSGVAGVVPLLLSGRMLKLALGAAASTVVGALARWRQRGRAGASLKALTSNNDPATEMQT